MNTNRDSFTLVETLITVGIVAVLAVVVVLAVNPAELFRQTRDSKRISDLALINNAINTFHVVNPSASLGGANTIYVSIPDSSSTCGNTGLSSLPSGWSYHCVTTSTLRKTNGTGWLPMNFTSSPQGTTIDQLPVDPTNTTSTGAYYTYLLVGHNWKLSTIMQSSKYASKMRLDGGPDNVAYEVGTDLTLVASSGSTPPSTNGLVGYWKFDEGTGTSVADYSGYGNTGTLNTSSAWTTGQVGGAYNFASRQMTVPDSASMELTGDMTISFVWKNMQDGSTCGQCKPRAIQKGVYENGTMEYSLEFESGDVVGGYGGSGSGWGISAERLMRDEKDNPVLGAWLDPHDNTAQVNSFHLITITRSGESGAVYEDGNLLYESLNGASSILWGASSDPFYIGPFNLSAPVVVDEFRIYNRALSRSEIQTIHDALF